MKSDHCPRNIGTSDQSNWNPHLATQQTDSPAAKNPRFFLMHGLKRMLSSSNSDLAACRCAGSFQRNLAKANAKWHTGWHTDEAGKQKIQVKSITWLSYLAETVSNCVAAANAIRWVHVAPVLQKLWGAENYLRTECDSKYDSALIALLDTMFFFRIGKEVQAMFFSGYRSGYNCNLSGEFMNKNKYLDSYFLFNV